MTAQKLALGLTLLTAGAILGGCQMVAWTVAQFAPPKKVKPIFEMPKEKKILVFVDSDRPLSYEPIKGMLTEQLNKQMLDNKIVKSVVSRDRLLDVLEEPSDHVLSNVEIGQKVGADLVLYVKVEKFSVKDDEASPLYVGKMNVTVRVIDVHAVKRIWPSDHAEHIVPPLELPPADDNSPSFGTQVAEALAAGMAERLAKMFYEHEVPNYGQGPTSGI